jgi:pterin-4a-carbinolamine dehydratase
MSKLSTEDLAQQMARHPEWQLTAPWLARDIQFKTFAEAWRFMNLIAHHAEGAGPPSQLV